MATYYWVNDGGTWDATTTTNWATSSGGVGGAGVPTSVDNAVFDNLSNATLYAVTVGTNAVAADISISGPASGNVTITLGATAALGCYGSWVNAATGVVFSTAGASQINFSATSTGNTITTNSVSLGQGNIRFVGVGGEWSLGSALTGTAASTVVLTNGTLNLANFNMAVGSFSSSNTNVRTLAFGATGVMALSGISGSVVAGSTATNLTVTGTAPLIQLTGTGAGTRNVVMFALPEAQAISLSVLNNATDTVIIQGALAGYKNIDFTNFNGLITTANTPNIYGNFTLGTNVVSLIGTNILTFASTSGTKTITSNGKTIDCPITFNGIGGTWACQDALTLGSTRALTMVNGTLQLKDSATNTVGSLVTSGTNMKYLRSTTLGTQATLSDASGTDTVTYLTIQDIAATGGATWNATSVTNIDGGNNTGWLFTAVSGVGSGTIPAFGFGFRI